MSVNEKMTAIADAIRGKTGKTDALTLDQMATEIAGIQVGGGGAPLEDALTGAWPSGEVVIDGITVSVGMFSNNQAMTKLKATNCVFKKAVQNCAALTEAEIDSSVQVSYLFQDCKALQKVKYNSDGTVGGQFRNCSNLEFVDCGPDFRYIGVYFAGDASKLKTLILRRPNKPVEIGIAQALNGSPFATDGTGGTAYVPAALIETYKTAGNWSALYAAGTCNFVAIEGSEYE